MASRAYIPPEKSLAQLISEFKEEIKEFASTRIAMLREEMREKLHSLTSALPALVIGAVLVLFAVFFFSIALVGVVAMALGGGAGAWAAAFAIVAMGFLLIGGFAILYGVNTLKAQNLKPERTLRVLKQDQAWFQRETRNEP